MTSIAMQLGLAPIPKKCVSGTKHLPEGASEVRSGGCTNAEHILRAADRRKSIVEMLQREPLTLKEIAEATDANHSIIEEDMRMMVTRGTVKKRLHQRENIYWSAS